MAIISEEGSASLRSRGAIPANLWAAEEVPPPKVVEEISGGSFY